MRTKPWLIGGLSAALFLACLGSADANGSAPVLTGLVTSQKEGPMEGVVVGAKKDGSTITVDVMTDQKGRYTFRDQNWIRSLHVEDPRCGLRSRRAQSHRCG